MVYFEGFTLIFRFTYDLRLRAIVEPHRDIAEEAGGVCGRYAVAYCCARQECCYLGGEEYPP